MLAACSTRAELAALLEDSLGEWFRASRRKVFFLGDFGDYSDNPVVRAFTQQETALHEAQVVDNATWRRLCPRADHGHVLVGPLLCAGKLVGALAVTRESELFDEADVRLMNRVSLHASTRLAALGPDFSGLTPREAEVAGAARRGLRNREIALELGLSEYTVKQMLKSIFRKLNVHTRSQLAMGRP
jgi:DNA-binding CsgD family transcriptional regulator